MWKGRQSIMLVQTFSSTFNFAIDFAEKGATIKLL